MEWQAQDAAVVRTHQWPVGGWAPLIQGVISVVRSERASGWPEGYCNTRYPGHNKTCPMMAVMLVVVAVMMLVNGIGLMVLVVPKQKVSSDMLDRIQVREHEVH